jgi:hypothetical protein
LREEVADRLVRQKSAETDDITLNLADPDGDDGGLASRQGRHRRTGLLGRCRRGEGKRRGGGGRQDKEAAEQEQRGYSNGADESYVLRCNRKVHSIHKNSRSRLQGPGEGGEGQGTVVPQAVSCRRRRGRCARRRSRPTAPSLAAALVTTTPLPCLRWLRASIQRSTKSDHSSSRGILVGVLGSADSSADSRRRGAGREPSPWRLRV